MLVRLTTSVPVCVIVDTDENVVQSVHVLDEEVAEFDHNHVDDDNTDAQIRPDDPIVQTAFDIAASCTWPAWEFGR